MSQLCHHPIPATPNTRWNFTLKQNKCVESPRGILSLFTTRFRLRMNSPYQRLWWHRHVVFCGAARFSYGESPRTPSFEGTSLDRRNMSVERPWGILSLFTTCLRLRVNSLAWLRPVSDYEWILEPYYIRFPITNEFPLQEAVTQICMWQLCGAGRFSYGESPRTPPTEEISLNRRNVSVERPLGILSPFPACFRLRVNSPCQKLWHRHVWGVLVEQGP